MLAGRDLAALSPAPAQNQNTIVVTEALATAHGLQAVSDLAPLAAELAFGGPAECPERYFCLGGLSTRYGLEFSSFTPMPNSEVVAAGLLSEVIDVGLLFSTDAVLVDPRLIVLRDDEGLQPAENIVPVVRNDALLRWGPDMAAVLDAVSARLDTGSLVRLNAEMAAPGETAASVAGRWLRSG